MNPVDNRYTLILANGMPSHDCLAGIFEFDQAKALSAHGRNVIFLALDLRSIKHRRKYGVQKFTKDGVLCYHASFPIGNVPLPLFKFFGSIALKRAYKKIIAENGKPVLIHAHFTDMGYLLSFLKKKFDVKTVLTEHSSAVNKTDVSKKTLKMAQAAYPAADALISVSKALRSSIARIQDGDIRVIPNIVDLECFMQANHVDGHAGYKFVSVGNLVEIKNFPVLIRAFGEAFGKDDDVSLDIIGDGPQAQMLDRLIKERKLENKVRLLGRKKREEIARIFCGADAFVLLSKAETFGVSFIEAMACGLPVIASKCGGPEDFITPENGSMVPIDDIGATVDALKKIRSTSFDKNAIIAYTVANFSSEVIAQNIIDVYEAVSN